jgi:predicted LPLAT superfamily acyltransferase
MHAAGSHTAASTKRDPRWTGRSRGGHFGNRFFVTLLRWFGLRPAYTVLIPVALYFVFFAPAARRAARRYRCRVRAERRSWWRQWVADFCHFYTFGRILLDRVAVLSRSGVPMQFDVHGVEHLRQGLCEGRGVILLIAHCGNWEAAGHELTRRIRTPVHIVAFDAADPATNAMAARDQYSESLRWIAAGDGLSTSLKIRQALRRGEIVAMQGDRLMNGGGIEVSFLGDLAQFPTGPHVVAAVQSAPLIHVFAMRERFRHYRVTVYPPQHLAFDLQYDRQAQLKEWVGQYVARLEDQLREFPLQWHNFYDFWHEDARAPLAPDAVPASEARVT